MMEFLFAHLWTIIAALGGLTTAATIALVIFGGVPLLAVTTTALGLIGKLVGFLKTPIGQAIAAVVLLCTVGFFADAHGHRQEMKITARKVAARDVYWKAQIKKAAEDFRAARSDRDDAVAGEIDKIVKAKLLEINAQEQAIRSVGLNHAADKTCALTPADVDDGGVRERANRTDAAAGAGRTRKQAGDREGHGGSHH